MDRLYSIITGELFSSISNVSILPAWRLPLLYSEPKKRTPKNVSKWRSIICCKDFSIATDCPANSSTASLFPQKY